MRLVKTVLNIWVLATLLLLLTLAAIANAQPDNIVVLSGTVYDQVGAVIPNTKIIALNDHGESFVTVTNEEGVYKLELKFVRYGSKKTLKAATYEITADRANTGFKKTILKDFKVVPAYKGSMQLDLVLEALDPEPCGYAGADCLNSAFEKNELSSLSNKISDRPKTEEIIKKVDQAKMRFCGTVRDEQGASIPGVTVNLKPEARSRTRTKYKFLTDTEGNFNIEVLDGLYEIIFSVSSFKKRVLKNQLLPYDPRQCITIELKSSVKPHQIT